jgi:putative ABC transport system permease protein
MAFDYWRDPFLVFALLLGVVAVGLAAGAYPAIILSAFRPARILRGWAGQPRTGMVRNALVMAQFSILIILMIAANVVYLQQAYLAREALRVNIDETLVVRAACPVGFLDGVRALPGVKGAACAGAELLDGVMLTEHDYKGKGMTLDVARVERPFFAQYGLWPVAGVLPSGPGSSEGKVPGLVINMAAVRHMGLASAKAAIGQPIWQEAPWGDLRIIAVVPDFALNNFENIPVPPTVYTDFGNGFEAPKDGDMVHIRLSGQQIPETLSAIDRLWAATGGEGAANRFFLDAHLQERYVSMLRQAQLFAMFAVIAVLLACLGLVGIAVSTAEKRTKEIGVRKAMGAEKSNIVLLLLWQFSKPVLWANLIALPAAWLALTSWLSGFAYHVAMPLWLFPAAGLGTLGIALLTVAAQSWITARQKPVLALRYE